MSKDSSAPSLPETLGLVVISYIIFYLALFMGGGARLIGGNTFGDNPSYLEAASAIRHWQFAGVTTKQFWGLSYAVAGLTAVTGIPLPAALVILCIVASLLTIVLCHHLWGGWVSVFFSLLSLDWFQRSLLGGAEPLFMATLLLAFMALRYARVRSAALSGAFSTIIRPFGLFALVGIGIQLLLQKKFREFAQATVIALGIGAAYVWPLMHYLGNPFANITSYQKADWHGGFPFSYPFAVIVRDTWTSHAPATNLVLTSIWIGLILAGLIAGFMNGSFRRYVAGYPGEICFVCLYCFALYTYDAPDWARSNFPRFAIPVLPWTLFFLRQYLPAQRWVIRSLVVVTPVLAAASAIGIRNVAAMLMSHH